MSAASDYLENELLDHVLRNAAYTPATTVYAALFTSAASLAELEAGTLTNEVTGGSYARQSITFAAASGGVTQNTAAVEFVNMPAVTVGFVAIMDAATVGNVLYYAALSANKTTSVGDTLSFAVGDLTVTLQ